ncbi:MAG: hypothetical protein WDO70_00150 [Alphaproteobacteria bacterium]
MPTIIDALCGARNGSNRLPGYIRQIKTAGAEKVSPDDAPRLAQRLVDVAAEPNSTHDDRLLALHLLDDMAKRHSRLVIPVIQETPAIAAVAECFPYWYVQGAARQLLATIEEKSGPSRPGSKGSAPAAPAPAAGPTA